MDADVPHPDFSGPEICRHEAHEVVALLGKREVSPSQLLDASLARISQVEEAVNAIPTVCAARARDTLADLADREKKHGKEPGWLGGLTIGIKDLTQVAGVRTTFGTRGFLNNVPEKSDPLVLLLEARGGTVVGKTNTPEMGAGGNTFNEVFGATRNPWDIRMNAGGSSGGSAVSLATGEVWLSHGSDLAGSLRTPAAYCGIVGLRPSPGRAGGGPPTLGFHTEGVQGPMARSVTDCALFLDTMSGFNPLSPISIEAPASPFSIAVTTPLHKARVAWAPDLNGFAPIEAEIQEVLEGSLRRFATNGAKVALDCPEISSLAPTYRVLRAMTWAALAGRLPADIQRHFKQALRENIEVDRNLSLDDVYDAPIDRTIIFNNLARFLEDFDVLATAVVGLRAQPVEVEYPTQVAGRPVEDYFDWLKFSFLATTAGLPAISMPAGFTRDGMPVGIQLIGPHRGEAKLLQAARACELALELPKFPIDPK